MGFISENIDRVERLISEDTAQSLTYAALECRTCIEFICYDRLRLAHDYISHDDLRKWQPRDVVKTLISEVFEHVCSESVLQISKNPFKNGDNLPNPTQFAEQEYVEVGRQSGIDPNKLGKLWNSLSSFLHVRVPTSSSDKLSSYGDIVKMRSKIQEVVEYLKAIDGGNMILSGMGEEVHFNCACGTTNKRRVSLLSQGKTVSCVNGGCDEKYTVEINEDQIDFIRQHVPLKCKSCEETEIIPLGPLLKMKYDQAAKIECRCGKRSRLRWGIRLDDDDNTKST